LYAHRVLLRIYERPRSSSLPSTGEQLANTFRNSMNAGNNDNLRTFEDERSINYGRTDRSAVIGTVWSGRQATVMILCMS